MTSVFNPAEFLNSTHEGGFETKRRTLPDGMEVLAQLVEGDQGLAIRTADTKNGVRYILSLSWEIIDDKAREITGMEKLRIRHRDIWLDLDENGRLRKGPNANIDLGKLLSGLGLNSDTWSPAQIRSVGLCKVKVGMSKPNDAGDQFNEVRAAVKYNGGA